MWSYDRAAGDVCADDDDLYPVDRTAAVDRRKAHTPAAGAGRWLCAGGALHGHDPGRCAGTAVLESDERLAEVRPAALQCVSHIDDPAACARSAVFRRSVRIAASMIAGQRKLWYASPWRVRS